MAFWNHFFNKGCGGSVLIFKQQCARPCASTQTGLCLLESPSSSLSCFHADWSGLNVQTRVCEATLAAMSCWRSVHLIIIHYIMLNRGLVLGSAATGRVRHLQTPGEGCVWEKVIKAWQTGEFEGLFHSHVGDVLHLRVALEDGESVDAPFWVHAGDPGAAAGAGRRACLGWHPRICRTHRHPDNHEQTPPQAPPRPRARPRRGRSPAHGSPGAHFRMSTSALKARWNSLHGPAQVGWTAKARRQDTGSK